MIGQTPLNRIRIGVSACLLGQRVRFDGGHRRNRFVTETLSRFVDFVPVCPEVELGLGVPRETMRLERARGALRLIAIRSGVDHTVAMRAYAELRAEDLAGHNLSGYVLKSNSPSCGMKRVAIYGPYGILPRGGRGLFATALLKRLPYLPMEEEGRLDDVRIRENFIERIFAYRHLREFFAGRWTAHGLGRFHRAHRFQLLAHSARAGEQLARLIAGPTDRSAELADRYQAGFMTALSQLATATRHRRILRQIAGLVRPHLDSASCRVLFTQIEDYAHGLVPRAAPLQALRDCVSALDLDSLRCQTYLRPYPEELLVSVQL